ncbi:MAG: LTA synthase family protein [Oscillospiraceae bacterium]|nr:LTA synthase family protein [Oscillospiraceae bacterium]
MPAFLHKTIDALYNTDFLRRVLLYWLCFFCWEMIFRVSSISGFFAFSILRVLLIALPSGMVFAAVLTLVKRSARMWVLLPSMLVVMILYGSQIVFRSIQPSFWGIGSLEHSTGIMSEFMPVIAPAMLRNLPWIFLLSLPIVAAILWERKERNVARGRQAVACVLAVAVIVNILAWVTFGFAARDFNSALGRFYGRNGSPTVMHEHSGVFGAFGLQLASFIVPRGTDSAMELAGTRRPSGSSPSPYGYNALDIDFEQLARDAGTPRLRQLHEFLANRMPSPKHELTGRFEGYNLIYIIAESLAPYAIRPDLTPTLYHMMNQGIHFTNFYNPSWPLSTLDGEYVLHTGLFPKPDIWSFVRAGRNEVWQPFTLGRQFEAMGMQPLAFHNHAYTFFQRYLSHPNMGYDFRAVGNGLDMELGEIFWRSDLEMMQLTVDEFIDKEQFHVYYLTVSGHKPYTADMHTMVARHWDAVAHLDYSERALGYLAANLELEHAVSYLMERLEAAGIAERTLIVLTPDHHPYGLEHWEIEELAGHEVEEELGVKHSLLIMYTHGMEPMTVDKPSSSVDVLPTVLNLMGLPFDSRLLIGVDILSDTPPLVMFNCRSFITENGRFYRKRNEFVPNPGVEIDENYINDILKIVNAEFAASAAILDLDYYRFLETYILAAKMQN